MSSSTTNGTTTTVGDSFTFSKQLTFGTGVASIFSASATIGYSRTTSESSAFTNTFTNTVSLATSDNSSATWNPNKSDAINHNLDSFIIWLNPEVTVFSLGTTANSYTTTSQATPGVSANVADILPPIPAITMEQNSSGVTTVPIQFLLPQAIASDTGGGNSFMPGLAAICANQTFYKQQLASANPATPTACTFADQCGCVPQDFVEILQTDPLLNYKRQHLHSKSDPWYGEPAANRRFGRQHLR